MPIEEFVFFGYRGLSAIVALVMAVTKLAMSAVPS